MPIALRFINLITPIATIEQKYPGGWEQCLKDYKSPITWYDEHLFRMGAMDPMSMKNLANRWIKKGFEMTTIKDGREVWKDFCIYELLFGSAFECEWLEVDRERRYAYLKGTDPIRSHGDDADHG